MKDAATPVIAIDGPSGAGKGTVSVILARRLGFHYLDSGALYRLLAVAAARHQVTFDNIDGLAVLAAHMDVLFRMAPGDAEPDITLEGEDVTRLQPRPTLPRRWGRPRFRCRSTRSISRWKPA